jgi:hypothetical protein
MKTRLRLGPLIGYIGAVLVCSFCSPRELTEKDIKLRLMKEHPIEAGWRKLEVIGVFPSNDDEATGHYLQHPVSLSLRDEATVFVADNFLHQVLNLDANGRYLETIGKRGEGPGEFNFPNRICTWEEYLFVLEGLKPRIQVFGHDNRFVRSFFIFDNINSFLVRDESIYANCVYPENEKELITVLNANGRVLKSFGLRIDREGHRSNDSRVFLSQTKTEIIALFEHYALIRRYTPEGKLIKEMTIESPIFRELEKYNYKRAYTNPSPQVVRLPRITAGVKAIGNKIYVLSHLPRLEIIELDLEGRILRTYYSESLRDVVNLTGFDARIEAEGNTSVGRLVFYVLQSSDEAKLHIFGTQSESSL